MCILSVCSMLGKGVYNNDNNDDENDSNSNGYIERLTRTDPKRLLIP